MCSHDGFSLLFLLATAALTILLIRLMSWHLNRCALLPGFQERAKLYRFYHLCNHYVRFLCSCRLPTIHNSSASEVADMVQKRHSTKTGVVKKHISAGGGAAPTIVCHTLWIATVCLTCM